jgi:hypothetical protein
MTPANRARPLTNGVANDDQRTLDIDAIGKALDILARYLEPGPRNADDQRPVDGAGR